MRLATAHSLAALAAITLGVTTASAQQYARPRVTAIVSPTPGVVEITIRFAEGEPRGAAILQVYRKEGRHESADGFDVLTRAGYPHRFMDTLGTTEITSDGTTLTLVASGLKSGVHSFAVRRTNGDFLSPIESDPSNVRVVEVLGSNSSDGVIGGGIAATPAGALAEAIEIVAVGGTPNPAMTSIEITWPSVISGTLHVTDIRGAAIITRPIEGEGRTSLDVSSLAPGVYHAVVEQGERIVRTRFVVAR